MCKVQKQNNKYEINGIFYCKSCYYQILTEKLEQKQELKRMGKYKYDFFGHLSEWGKKEIGHLFPKGTVPLKSMVSSLANLENTPEIKDVYFINIKQLTESEFDGCIEYIVKNCPIKATADIIKTNIESDGFIILRSKFISTTGTERMELFI